MEEKKNYFLNFFVVAIMAVLLSHHSGPVVVSAASNSHHGNILAAEHIRFKVQYNVTCYFVMHCSYYRCMYMYMCLYIHVHVYMYTYTVHCLLCMCAFFSPYLTYTYVLVNVTNSVGSLLSGRQLFTLPPPSSRARVGSAHPPPL